jgi:uncharacterized protein involved in response to NO
MLDCVSTASSFFFYFLLLLYFLSLHYLWTNRTTPNYLVSPMFVALGVVVLVVAVEVMVQGEYLSRLLWSDYTDYVDQNNTIPRILQVL